MQHKFTLLGKLALSKEDLVQFILNLETIKEQTNESLQNLYECNIKYAEVSIDGDVE